MTIESRVETPNLPPAPPRYDALEEALFRASLQRQLEEIVELLRQLVEEVNAL